MSIPFHSRITYQNRSKNEQAMPKGSKITLLGLDAKGNKNQKIRNKHPTNFCHIFQGKKNFSNQTSRNMRSGGGSLESTLYYCARTCICMQKIWCWMNQLTWSFKLSNGSNLSFISAFLSQLMNYFVFTLSFSCVIKWNKIFISYFEILQKTFFYNNIWYLCNIFAIFQNKK